MDQKSGHGNGERRGCGFHLKQTCLGCPAQGDCKIEKWLNAVDLVIEGDRYVIPEKVTTPA